MCFLQDHLFTKSHIELLKQSEDCHDGPLPTNMLARLASPVPSAQSSRSAAVSGGSSASRRPPVEVSPEMRTKSEQMSGRKAASSTAKREREAAADGAGQGMASMSAMGPFGDLGAMMMSDPNLQMAYMYASMNPYYNPAAAMMNPYAGKCSRRA